jgi:hypothetical protein
MVAASVAWGTWYSAGGQQQGGGQDARGREHARRRRAGPGVEVHHGAREAAGDRKPAGEGRAQVAGAQGHEFGIRFDALAAPRGQRLADRNRLDEADHADQQRRHRQFLPECQVPQRAGERRQARGHGADDLHPLLVQLERPGQDRG